MGNGDDGRVKLEPGTRLVDTAALIGPDYLEEIAVHTLRYSGFAGQEREAWSHMPHEKRARVMNGVSGVLAAMHELGWKFVPPPRV